MATGSKRQFLKQFDLRDQTTLLGIGLDLLRRAGGDGVNAFRAGSFGCNADTLMAVELNGLAFDSSYNPLLFGMDSGIAEGRTLLDLTPVGALHELPMTIFRDGMRRLRHAQLGACSFEELRAALEDAQRVGLQSFMMLSHNFELLTPTRDRADRIVVDRMRRLCAFLDRNRDRFPTRGFIGFEPERAPQITLPLEVPVWPTLRRLGEQALRRGLY